MLAGCTPWPEEFAKRYRDLGYWRRITLTDMLVRSIHRAPDKTALVHGGERISYRSLGETLDRLACGFIAAGIGPLDRGDGAFEAHTPHSRTDLGLARFRRSRTLRLVLAQGDPERAAPVSRRNCAAACASASAACRRRSTAPPKG